MLSVHNYESGMQFTDISMDKNNKSVVCSISEVHCRNLSTQANGHFEELKKGHLREVESIQDRYARLAKTGFHQGAFQSIQSLLLSENSKSAFARIGLPEGHEHEHDNYYHAHPAVLDGAFQLLGFVSNTLTEGETYVPAGINRVILHHQLDCCSNNKMLAHAELIDDGSKMNSCVFDESGEVLLSIEGFRCAKLKSTANETEVSVFTTKWVQSSCLGGVSISDDYINGHNINRHVLFVQLEGCYPIQFNPEMTMSKTYTVQEMEMLDILRNYNLRHLLCQCSIFKPSPVLMMTL